MNWSQVFIAIIPIVGYAVRYVEDYAQQSPGSVKQSQAIAYVKDTLRLPTSDAAVLNDPIVDRALRDMIDASVRLQNVIAQRTAALAPAK